MGKVFIHIGLPKTATSTIQDFLFNNSKFLQSQNLRYIKTGLDEKLKCHHKLIWELGLHNGLRYVKNDIIKYKKESLSKLQIESRKYLDDDLILSSELLTFVDNYKDLQPLIEAFENRNIFYIINIRKQDSFLESLYQQVVKDGCVETFKEWFPHAQKVARYDILIYKVLQLTNKENIILNLFNPKAGSFNPVYDFLCSLGMDKNRLNDISIKNKIENKSLSNEAIEMIRLSNKLRLNINYFLIDKLDQYDYTKAKFFNKSQRKEIEEYYHYSNNEFINLLSLPNTYKEVLLSKTYGT